MFALVNNRSDWHTMGKILGGIVVCNQQTVFRRLRGAQFARSRRRAPVDLAEDADRREPA
ncbi:MAG: hypothetical protein GDA49_01995 [Rhodospirillales bacterium]|nr:hypothetical protein [Rhodospirillales bacterium]